MGGVVLESLSRPTGMRPTGMRGGPSPPKTVLLVSGAKVTAAPSVARVRARVLGSPSVDAP